MTAAPAALRIAAQIFPVPILTDQPMALAIGPTVATAVTVTAGMAAAVEVVAVGTNGNLRHISPLTYFLCRNYFIFSLLRLIRR